MTVLNMGDFCREFPLIVEDIEDLEGNRHTWTIKPYSADVELAVRELEKKGQEQNLTVGERYAPILALFIDKEDITPEWLTAHFSGFVMREVVKRVLFFFLFGSLPPTYPWESPQPQTTSPTPSPA